jgi:phage antirepressor YoqD-like protein
MSSNLPERAPGSPFDALKRTDEHGEYWMARDLMRPLGYSTWERFVAVVEKAAESLRIVQGEGVVAEVFRKIAKNPSRQGGRPGEDYRLTRFAAYLTAMAGDDTKPQVAEARIYFAVRTREAEVAPLQLVSDPRVPKSFGAALRLAAEQQLEIEDRDRTIEEQRSALDWAEPRAAYVDKFVDGAGDATTVRDTAKQLEVPERKFREWLIRRGLIYRLPNGEYRKRALLGPRQHWFILQDQPQAPRHHNGQIRQTLYVTPAGKVGIEALLLKYPITGQGELDIDEAS